VLPSRQGDIFSGKIRSPLRAFALVCEYGHLGFCDKSPCYCFSIHTVHRCVVRVECAGFRVASDHLRAPAVEVLYFVMVDVGDEGLAKERDEIEFKRLDVIFVDFTPCLSVQLPLHIRNGQLRNVLKAFGHNRQVMLGAEAILQILVTGHSLGFFQVTLACADPHPVLINLERGLPALAVVALVDFHLTAQQQVCLWTEVRPCCVSPKLHRTLWACIGVVRRKSGGLVADLAWSVIIEAGRADSCR